MSKIKNTFSLAGASWAVLKADKALLLLPVMSSIASTVVALSFVVPPFLVGGGTEEPTPVTYVLMFAMYVALAFVTIFFNAALVAGAYERLRGGDPTLSSALAGAAAKVGRILPWAVVSATVSVLIQAIQQRGGGAGRGVAAAAGLAWSMVTFLVVPVFVIEDIGVVAAVKRSTSLFKRTWGENVTARVGFGLLGFLLALPAVLFVIAGFALGSVGAGIGIGIAVLWVVAVTLVMAALSSVFQTALYLYATEQDEPAGYFQTTQFQQAFAPKGTATA